MGRFYDKKKLEEMLRSNNIPLNNATAKGEFFKNNFDWKKYAESYSNGLSMEKICKELNLSYDVVRVNLKRQGVTFRRFVGVSTNTYTLGMFEPLNNIGAYLLGWFYSDGHVSKDGKNVTLAVSCKDQEHLTYLRDLMTDAPIRKYKNAVRFNIYSEYLNGLLREKYLMTNRKSYTNYRMPIDDLTDEQMVYFLLGMLEGDGSVRKTTAAELLFPSKTTPIIEDFLTNIGIFIDKKKILNEHGLQMLYFKGINFYKLLTLLYSFTPDIKPMKRKRERFLERAKISMNGRTSPYKEIAQVAWDSLNNVETC